MTGYGDFKLLVPSTTGAKECELTVQMVYFTTDGLTGQ